MRRRPAGPWIISCMSAGCSRPTSCQDIRAGWA